MPMLTYDGTHRVIVASRCVTLVGRTATGVYEVAVVYPTNADAWAVDASVSGRPDGFVSATAGRHGRWTIRTYDLPGVPADRRFTAHWYAGRTD